MYKVFRGIVTIMHMGRMWASAHAQKISIPVSIVTAADTPIFKEFFIIIFFLFFRELPCRKINGGQNNLGSTVFYLIMQIGQ